MVSIGAPVPEQITVGIEHKDIADIRIVQCASVVSYVHVTGSVNGDAIRISEIALGPRFYVVSIEVKYVYAVIALISHIKEGTINDNRPRIFELPKAGAATSNLPYKVAAAVEFLYSAIGVVLIIAYVDAA